MITQGDVDQATYNLRLR